MASGVSGIVVADEVVETYLQFKLKKEFKYLAFKITDDGKQIVPAGSGGTYDGPYSEFVDVVKDLESGGGCG